MNAIASAWKDLYASTLERARNATGPLKAHYEAEAAQMKPTLDALDIRDPADPPAPAPAPAPTTTSTATTTPTGSYPVVDSNASTPAASPAANVPPVTNTPKVERTPAVSSVTPSSLPPQASPASSSYVDSNKKLAELQGLINQAAAESGVPASLIGAVMVKESRGWSIANMPGAGGLMQNGKAEFDETAARHPELQGLAWDSTEGQIRGAAFRLADLKAKSGSWDGALTMYNGGEFRGGLVDPNYLIRVHEYQSIIEQGGQLPS